MLTRRASLRTRPRPTMIRTRVEISERSQGRCELRLGDVRCVRRAVDPAHVVKRSSFGRKRRAYGDAAVRVLALCRPCHRMEDRPYAEGKLVHRERDGVIASRIFYDKRAARDWRGPEA